VGRGRSACASVSERGQRGHVSGGVTCSRRSSAAVVVTAVVLGEVALRMRWQSERERQGDLPVQH
jgi:hypothetical protein